jgi:hypothetical protein
MNTLWERIKEQAAIVYRKGSQIFVFELACFYILACVVAGGPLGPKGFVTFTYYCFRWPGPVRRVVGASRTPAKRVFKGATLMDKQLEKLNPENALSRERRRMDEALARLNVNVSQKHPAARPARLPFVLDLTGSRASSLRRARIATAEMFRQLKAIGSIRVKLIYFRGENECKAGSWESDPDVVSRAMEQLACETGETQIARSLRCILDGEAEISGVVFIGDHCEDKRSELKALAVEFGERRVPLHIFHECADLDLRSLRAKPIFKHMAEASGGTYSEFRPDAGDVLRELLSSVAAFSAGGAEGIKQAPAPQTPEARQLQKRLLLLGPGAEAKGC